MTDVFTEKAGKYTGRLKKAYAWVEDEGEGRPLVNGTELAVRSGFLMKRVTGVSKIMSIETAPGFEQPERFPNGFTPDPPIPDVSTGLYSGWMIIGDNKASMLADETGIYADMPAINQAYDYFLRNSRDGSGRLLYRYDRRARRWNVPDGLYKYANGQFIPLGEVDSEIPRDMDGLRDYFAKNDLEGVIFTHESGATGVALAAKIPSKKDEPSIE